MRLSLLTAAALCVSALAAHADVMFSVSGVTTQGGALKGTFTTNNALTSILAFNIDIPASGAFSEFDYTPANATVSAATLPSQYFRIDTPGNIDELQFYFNNGLTAQGGTLNAFASYENQPSGGNRFLSGTVTAIQPTATTPEPSSFALLGTGLLGALGMARKRLA